MGPYRDDVVVGYGWYGGDWEAENNDRITRRIMCLLIDLHCFITSLGLFLSSDFCRIVISDTLEYFHIVVNIQFMLLS